MTRRTELMALAERVEKGEAGYAISDECWLALGWKNDGRYWRRPNDGLIEAVIMPDLILSIDAQAALPGRIVKVWTTPDGMGAEAESGSVISECVSAPTEAAARLAALLRAMADDAA